MNQINILWVDDEIESLKSQIIFLENKGYKVSALTNGYDALEFLKENIVDVVLLDESMPGITGLETLSKIKEINQQIPIVMITKNEAENVMDDAIGSQITDYLIKPVNPNQVLLSLKKIIDNKRLVAEKTTTAYQQQFRTLFMALNDNPDHAEWAEIYKKLVYWEMEMSKSDSPEMMEILHSQKAEANAEFAKFIARNYSSWMQPKAKDAPVMSHTLFSQKVVPNLDPNVPNFFILIDNLRYDLYEEFFLKEQLARLKMDPRFSYTKVTNHADGQHMVNNIHNLLDFPLNVIVYNFVDMLSHARTEMEVLKELAADEIAYRSITASWFEHSPLYQALKRIADKKVNLIIATDHGSVRVKNPVKVIGDKQTTTNLRYKHGRNLNYDPKEVLAFRDPKEAGLPRPNVNSSYIFAREDGYLCYPNNYNYFVNYYRNTFQHGGISLEEMIVPVARMVSK